MESRNLRGAIPDYVDFTYIDMPPSRRRELDVGDIFLNQGVCTECGWVMRSKHRHDMARCKCGKSFIDGGSWYSRVGGFVDMKAVYYADPHSQEFPFLAPAERDSLKTRRTGDE